jgi:hypothetical protein
MRTVLDWLNATLNSGKQVKTVFAELMAANGGSMIARPGMHPQQIVTLAHMHGMYNGFIQAHMENPAHIAASEMLLKEEMQKLVGGVQMYSESDLKNVRFG